jgi:hypothetical protein
VTEEDRQKLRAARKESAELRRHLKELTVAVKQALRAIDAEMKKPSTYERGQRIGAIVGTLEFASDRARHFGLGEALGTPDPAKVKAYQEKHS